MIKVGLAFLYLVTVATAAGPDQRDEVSAGDLLVCPLYRDWSRRMEEREGKVLANQVDYLSWGEFVALRTFRSIPLEQKCNNKWRPE